MNEYLCNIYNLEYWKDVNMKKNTKKAEGKEKSVFDFQDEIVIGINSPKALEEKKKTESKKKTNVKQNTNSKNTKKQPVEKSKTKKKAISAKKSNKSEKIKENKSLAIVKWSILIILLIGAIIYFLMSPLFNIRSIIIEGNAKVTEHEIESLSQLKMGQNIFNFSKLETKENIKDNPYIAEVNIDRKFPYTVKIHVTERIATFILELGSAYIYMDNQGYALEVSSEKLELPVITSLKVDTSEFMPGNRLEKEDLVKLEEILAIMSTAKSNELYGKITKIDANSSSNYILTMDDGKTVYMGDVNNLDVKMLYLKQILEDVEGLEGEVFLQSNNKEMFFREKI